MRGWRRRTGRANGIVIPALLSLLLGFARSDAQPPAKAGLCGIKTVYVELYSESSGRVEDAVKKRTWLKVVRSQDKANAVLEFHETWGKPDPSTHGEPMTITAVLKSQDGNLWSGTQSWGDGSVNADLGSAAKALMTKLNEDAGGCK